MEVTREGLPVEIPNDEYNWRHLALFETQMIEPAKFNSYYKSENYQEWYFLNSGYLNLSLGYGN
jgi:hypothetical protein